MRHAFLTSSAELEAAQPGAAAKSSADEVRRHAPAAVRAERRRDRLGRAALSLEDAVEPDHDVGPLQGAGRALHDRARAQLAPEAPAEGHSYRAEGRVPVARSDLLPQEGAAAAQLAGCRPWSTSRSSSSGPNGCARGYLPRSATATSSETPSRSRSSSTSTATRPSSTAPAWTADPLVCVRCGQRVDLIAFVTDQMTITKILEHLGLSTPEAAKPPPPAREVLRVAEHADGWGVPAQWE